jgi:beta-galactosidase
VAAVQLENEYFWGDIPYHQALKEIAEGVGVDVPIYTNANRYARNAGFIDSLDLYPDPWDLDGVVKAFEDIRATQRGPIKIMEYEGGWFARIDKPLPTERGHFPAEWTQALLAAAMAYGADLISFYMFHGGTNFAYWTGRWIATTYDYEAAVREWGELSDRFYRIRLLAYLRDLLEGGEEEAVEYSSRRLRAVRRLRRGGSLAFYVNASDEPWAVDGVEIPPRSTAVLPRGVAAGGLALTSSLSLMAVVGDTALLYGDRGKAFSAVVEGASAYKCRGVEASLSGNALAVKGVVDGVSGCVVEGPRGRLRVLFLPTEVAERTWIIGETPIPSTAYFLRGEGEGGALVFELRGRPRSTCRGGRRLGNT